MLIESARKGLRAPVNLTWEITLRCNLNCRHCLSDAGTPHAHELSTTECKAVIDHLARHKVFQINIGGGEPMVRPDFFEIMDYANEKGIVACISTNGTLLDDDTCRHLAAMKDIFLQVSLDGVDEESNDSIRGKGTYQRAVKGMRNLQRYQVPFSINTVLTRSSFSQLEALKSMAQRFDATLRVSRFRPSGRAKACWKELAPHQGAAGTICPLAPGGCGCVDRGFVFQPHL